MINHKLHFTKENKVDTIINNFFVRHPYISYIAMFIGMPLAILFSVILLSMIIAYPMLYLFGWL